MGNLLQIRVRALFQRTVRASAQIQLPLAEGGSGRARVRLRHLAGEKEPVVG